MKLELEVHKNKSYCNSELGKEKAVDTEGGKSGGWKSNLWRSIIQVNEFGRGGDGVIWEQKLEFGRRKRSKNQEQVTGWIIHERKVSIAEPGRQHPSFHSVAALKTAIKTMINRDLGERGSLNEKCTP